MASEQTRIELSIKEVYAQLCPRCKAKVSQLIKKRGGEMVHRQLVGSD